MIGRSGCFPEAPTFFQRAGLCREDQLLLRFFGRGSRQLNLNRASLAKQGAESSGRPFSTWCSSACRSTCKLRDLKSPAPIPDPGLVLNDFSDWKNAIFSTLKSRFCGPVCSYYSYSKKYVIGR